MCPGLDQAGAAAGSSGVSQDKFWCWLPGLGEEELLDLWEILDLWELLGLSEFLGLWVPGSAELVSFWELLGLEELSDFFGGSGFLRATGFALSLELPDSPSPVQGAGAGSCLCFSLTTTDLKIKTGEIP